jgi:hypothetical protein
MPVSVSNTVYGIINDAMQDAGLLQEGSEPNSEQLSNGMRRLCDLINLWQTQGLKLFLQEEISVDLTAGQGTYTVNPIGLSPAKHLRILQGRVVNTSGQTLRELRSISWNEWNGLPHAQSGTVTGYLVDKQASSLIVKVWNTPDSVEATNNLILLVHKQAVNPYNLESDVAFPQEWRVALRWGLADDICTGQPQAIMDRCQSRAEAFRSALEDWDVEDTDTRFTISGSNTEGGSFR